MRDRTAPSPSPTHATAAGRPDAAPVPLRRRLWRDLWPVRLRGARWAGRLLRVGVLLPLAFLAIAPFLLIGQEVTAPGWIRERVEASAADALGGGRLRFSAITVRVPGDLHPEVRLLGVTLADRSGQVLARVPEVTAQVSPRGLLFEHRLLVQEVALGGAELTLRRDEEGRVDLAFGAGGGPQVPVGRAEGLASLPDQFERLFERPALEALRRVRVGGLVVNYEDARAGRAWTLDGGELTLDLSGGMTRLRGEVSLLSGRSYVSRARLDYESPRGSRAARIGATITDVAAADVASQSPALTWLRVVDAPISMAVRVELDEGGALGPTNVALKMARGELRPNAATRVPFDVARAYLSYDPAAQAVEFDRVEVRSDWGSVLGEGQAWLREIEAGLPRALLGQFRLSEIVAAPPGLYAEPVRLPQAEAQFRLRLDPFTVDVAEASLGLPGGEEGRVALGGRVEASPDGWHVALDAGLAQVTRDGVLALWPERLRPGLRDWLDANLTAGRLRDVAAALRIAPGVAPEVALTAGFEGLAVRPLPTEPPITGGAGAMQWQDGTFAVTLDRGRVAAPEGGMVEMGGTSFVIHPGDSARAPATVHLDAEGPVTAALSLLDQPPWRFLSGAELPVDLAEGRAEVGGTVDLFLGPMQPDELRYDIAAVLSDVRTEVLVPGKVLTAESLAVAVTPDGIDIGGDMRLGSVPLRGGWRQGFSPEEQGRSRVTAQVGITPKALEELGVLLPSGSVAGEGTGELVVDLARGEAARYSLRSDLRGLGLSVSELGWSKGRDAGGALRVAGRLGSPATVERLSLSAPGLSAEGSVRLTPEGGFDRLRLSSLTVGDWLEVPLTLSARAGHDTPAVEVTGGRLDLSRATFGKGAEGGEGGPITANLDRVQVTESVALTGFAGEFGTENGLEGVFSGQVNGGPTVTGRVAPQGDRVAARIRGADAGAVMTAANLFTRAEGGALDLLLLPEGDESYTGELWITGLRVVEAPVLASLLNAASGIGLLQQLSGQGIVFDEVAADFRIDPTLVIVERASAQGAGLGLSASGAFDTEAWWMDLEGVLSPFYLVNGIGSILTRPGEGLLGANFTLKGSPDAPTLGVNPLSLLAPGGLRELFRRRP
ncbi:DUF3971 domain-containing protein [Rubellimicrobium roseum]|uniref:DUF3971 domain-containing protein n=1 Tax=Rubellimicrobium roseum TaxID=687525 RepID=A0A5C4NBG8_9RHOB|nr:DUF3971 domain-containing protein [Rubellimicrobium roseum]TNC71382.1 DUF3971 domain-containing protein [Rubellimicrobium roseum]